MSRAASGDDRSTSERILDLQDEWDKIASSPYFEDRQVIVSRNRFRRTSKRQPKSNPPGSRKLTHPRRLEESVLPSSRGGPQALDGING